MNKGTKIVVCGAIAFFSMMIAGIMQELKSHGWGIVYIIAIPTIMYIWNMKSPKGSSGADIETKNKRSARKEGLKSSTSDKIYNVAIWCFWLFVIGVLAVKFLPSLTDNRSRFSQKKQSSNREYVAPRLVSTSFSLDNMTLTAVRFKLFDKKYNLVWPDRENVYVAPQQLKPQKIYFKCWEGSVICYGAESTFEDSSGEKVSRWGVNIDSPGTRTPEDACFVCGQKEEVVVTLVRDQSNQSYKTSAPPPPPPNKDKEYSELLCGSWYVDRKLANGTKINVAVNYNPEGSYKVKLNVEVDPSQKKFSTVLGSWKIINGFLVERIQSSGEPINFPVGKQETSRIHSLSNKIFVLEDVESKELITFKKKY